MPSAHSAASRKPHKHNLKPGSDGTDPGVSDRKRARRLWTVALGAILGASIVVPAATVQAPVVEALAGSNGCKSWSSTTRPPYSIRVLRRASGRVVRVPFRAYVVTVMGKEWPSYLPQPVVEAGAVAVKQYAWYHALTRANRSARGQCFDVTDGVSDQLYKPGRARVRPDHRAAVSKTWGVRLLKNGRLFMTGYRRGADVRCGRDHTGYKLFALSATNCAHRGYSYLQILRRYYGPGLDLIRGSQLESRGSLRSSRKPSEPARQRPQRSPRRDPPAVAATSAAVRALLAELALSEAPLDLIARRGPRAGVIDVHAHGVFVARVDLYVGELATAIR